MNNQIIFIIAIALFLNGCVPIRVIPKYSPDTYNGYKVIQAYQKKDTIGYTDVEQRKKDAFACGVRNYFDGNLDLNQHYPEMTIQQIIDRRIRIDNCMENKGYIIHSKERCTINGKPTGFCN
ncbi:hypothetical protein C9426_30200 [Serratia sp. S1B]|nr:hypothetical protein C9426_30200 [Serratia sp. S1B]